MFEDKLTPAQRIIWNNGKKFQGEADFKKAVEALLKLSSAQQGVYLTKSRWAIFLDKLFAAFRR